MSGGVRISVLLPGILPVLCVTSGCCSNSGRLMQSIFPRSVRPIVVVYAETGRNPVGDACAANSSISAVLRYAADVMFPVLHDTGPSEGRSLHSRLCGSGGGTPRFICRRTGSGNPLSQRRFNSRTVTAVTGVYVGFVKQIGSIPGVFVNWLTSGRFTQVKGESRHRIS